MPDHSSKIWSYPHQLEAEENSTCLHTAILCKSRDKMKSLASAQTWEKLLWSEVQHVKTSISEKAGEVTVSALLITSLKLLVSIPCGAWSSEGVCNITYYPFTWGWLRWTLRHQRVLMIHSCGKLQDKGWILICAHLWGSSNCTLMRFEFLKPISAELCWMKNSYSIIILLPQLKHGNI